jgi:hypothetical protein
LKRSDPESYYSAHCPEVLSSKKSEREANLELYRERGLFLSVRDFLISVRRFCFAFFPFKPAGFLEGEWGNIIFSCGKKLDW